MLFDKLPATMWENLCSNSKTDWMDHEIIIQAYNEVHNLEVSNKEPGRQERVDPTAAFAMQ